MTSEYIKSVIFGLLGMGVIYGICFMISKLKNKQNNEFYLPKAPRKIPMPKGVTLPRADNGVGVHVNPTTKPFPGAPSPQYPRPNIKSKKDFVTKLEVGLKIECSHEAFENIIKDDYIQEFFTLNIKRLENNRYSIYFDDKKDLFIKWC